MALVCSLRSPLTKCAQAIGYASRGLTILSHKGRGKTAAPALPQMRLEIVAPYLSPCGRGYEGRVNAVNPWPELVRGEKPHFNGAAV
jgi:hypothetical protein